MHNFHAVSEGEASKTKQTSKIVLHVRTISAANNFRKKSSILDVRLGSEYASVKQFL